MKTLKAPSVRASRNGGLGYPSAFLARQRGMRQFFFCLLGFFAASSGALWGVEYSIGNPSAGEQYLLELINRARSEPAIEASRHGVGLNDGVTSGEWIYDTPKQPLAFQPNLLAAARSHSQWMLWSGVFSHTGSGGSSSTDRMRAAGYPLTGSWATGENIAVGTYFTSLQATIDYLHQGLFQSVGHRVNLLDGYFTEIGTATETGNFAFSGGTYYSLMITENFATSSATPGPVVTGVVFNDLDADRFYDIGEGLGGATILVEGSQYTATSTASGGWAVPVPGDGYYKVTANVPGFGESVSGVFVQNGQNAKVDFFVQSYSLYAQSRTYGFGPLSEVGDNLFWSDSYGYLSFGGDGTDPSWAWSESLQSWLSTDGSQVYSFHYGYLSSNGSSGWLSSGRLGWIQVHGFGGDVPAGASVWANSLGWISVLVSGQTTYYWSTFLQGWMAVDPSEATYSYDFGWVVPSGYAGLVYSTALGWIYTGEYDGWVWSSRFGWVYPYKDGTATYFWAHSLGWLVANGTGSVYYSAGGQWL